MREGYTPQVVEKDLYAVLGVEPAADLATIRKAYHKLALKHHPDRNKGSKESEELFREISAAYSILSDEKLRKVYDLRRSRPAPQQAPGGAYTAPAPEGNDGWADVTRKYEAVKNSYFWKASERRRSQNEQRSRRSAPGMGARSIFDLSPMEDVPGQGIQAPWDAGVPVKIVGQNAPTLGESIRIVNPMGPIPQFSMWRKKPDA